MRRLILLLVTVVAIGGGAAVALASHGAAARSVGLPAARHDRLQVIAFTEARPTPAARGSLSAHLASLDAISPAWLSLGPEGTIAYRDSDAFSRSLATRGAAILPVLNDPQQRISRLLADPPMRRRTALRLGVILRALGAQGIVLDLGRIDPSERLALPAFVRDLRAQLPETSRVLIVVPPISDAASRSAAAGYDLRDLSRPATLILRAWGGTGHASEPHPIASLGWFKRTVRYTLAHAPRSRVIVALPTWGAIWGPNGRHARDAGRPVPARRPGRARAACRRPDRAERPGRVGRVRSLAAAEARGRACGARRRRRAVGARRRVDRRLARTADRSAGLTPGYPPATSRRRNTTPATSAAGTP